MTLTDDEVEFFEERAAIKEFDGGLSCAEAERQALKEVIARRKAARDNVKPK